MKVSIVIIILFISTSLLAGETLNYSTYAEGSNEIVSRTAFQIDDIQNGLIHVEWQSFVSGRYVKHVLNGEFANIEWHAITPNENTDYLGERIENTLVLNGTFKGKKINKIIRLDENPFFCHPILGLSEFARSPHQSCEFWILRPDNLAKYKLEALKLDVEYITVDCKKIKAIKVRWGLRGILSKLFSQTFWFRVSDGVFIKSQPSRGEFTVLTNEL
jgi:hypothetical protein